MLKTKIILINLLLIILFAKAQVNNYGSENWPGKNSLMKNNIELKDSLALKYNLYLAKGSINNSVIYKMPINSYDTMLIGKLYIQIYLSPTEAQSYLVEYLNLITNINKPTRLTNENYNCGDVAFAYEYNETIDLSFTKNNVLVIIYGANDMVVSLAKKITEIIENADILNENENLKLIF